MSATFPPGTADYVLIENVPVFHEIRQHDVKGALPYSAAVIDDIAAFNNERVAIGEVPVIAIGHPELAIPERPIHGFLGNFTTGMRNGLKHLFCTLAVYKEFFPELKKYPRRSIELIQRGEKRFAVNAMALVGGSEPALDLGVLCFTSDRPDMATFTMDNEQETEAPAEITVDPQLEKQILHVLSKTDVYAYCHTQMKAAGEAEAQGDQEQMTNDDAEKPADGEGDEKGGEGAPGEEGQSAEKQDDSARESEGEERKEEDKDEKRSDNFTAVEAENSALKKQLRNMEREKVLLGLEGAGHVFTVADELRDFDDLGDELFTSHVERLKKFTKRAPIGQKFSVADVVSGGKTSDTVDNERGKRAQAYARQHGCTFKEAWDKV